MSEWWRYKFVPVLTGFYATALYVNAPVSGLWLDLVVLLLSLIPGAAFVSIVNDLTDLAADAAAGKPNRMSALPGWARVAAVTGSVAAGAPFLWFWSDQPLAMALYAAAWLAFLLYSLPPVRLKARGAAGLCADAAGANVFPTLLAAATAFAAAGRAPDMTWLAILCCWTFAAGCRGNLWHQLLDREHDLRGGIATFAVRHSDRIIGRAAVAIFAVEIAALAALLLVLASPLAMLAALLHVALAYRRRRVWHLATIIARPRDHYRIWLDDYYGALLPVSILLASAGSGTQPAEFAVLLAHLLLFPRWPLEVVHDIRSLIIRPLLSRLGYRSRTAGLSDRKPLP